MNDHHEQWTVTKSVTLWIANMYIKHLNSLLIAFHIIVITTNDGGFHSSYLSLCWVVYMNHWFLGCVYGISVHVLEGVMHPNLSDLRISLHLYH